MADQSPGDRRPPSVAVPWYFFDEILPAMRDLAEVNVLLTTYRLLAEPAWAADGMLPEVALFADDRLLRSLHRVGAARPPTEAIRRGIELALARGSLLRFRVVSEECGDAWLIPATPENRLRLTLIERGELPLPRSIALGDPDTGRGARIEPERPNVFRLYEQNVGLVSPIIADQLIEALEIYPEEWIEEAIHEAVGYNHRHWRYIQSILERWASEGRGDEANRRSGRAAGSLDPEKYLRGKYAKQFRRGE